MVPYDVALLCGIIWGGTIVGIVACNWCEAIYWVYVDWKADGNTNS